MARMRDGWRPVVLVAPLVLAVIAGLVPILWPPDREPDDDFYTAAAQIIPVLLLALIVEGRSAELWRRSDGRSYGQVIVVVLLIGELSTMLEAGDILGVMASLSVTSAALIGGFAAVTVVAVAPSEWFGKPADRQGDRTVRA